MKPVKLTLMGVRSFKEKEVIDFPEQGLMAIVGPTGSGKSSILEALIYALYNASSWSEGSARPLISQGATQMSVSLEFESDNQRWRVSRSMQAGSGPSVHLLEELGEGGSRWDKENVVNQKIKDLVGLDYEGFCSAVILPQGQFQRLLLSRPVERSEVLKGVLQLKVLEAMREEGVKERESWMGQLAKWEEERRRLVYQDEEGVKAARKELTEQELQGVEAKRWWEHWREQRQQITVEEENWKRKQERLKRVRLINIAEVEVKQIRSDLVRLHRRGWRRKNVEERIKRNEIGGWKLIQEKLNELEQEGVAINNRELQLRQLYMQSEQVVAVLSGNEGADAGASSGGLKLGNEHLMVILLEKEAAIKEEWRRLVVKGEGLALSLNRDNWRQEIARRRSDYERKEKLLRKWQKGMEKVRKTQVIDKAVEAEVQRKISTWREAAVLLEEITGGEITFERERLMGEEWDEELSKISQKRDQWMDERAKEMAIADAVEINKAIDEEERWYRVMIETEVRADELRQKLKQMEEEKNGALELDEKIAQGIQKKELAELVATNLGRNRFVNYVVKEREQELLGVASDIWGKISKNKFGFGPALTVIERERGVVREPRSLSGGEMFLASLALALALVEISERSGKEVETLFLDEGFGSLDGEALEGALDALEEEAQRGRAIVLISHLKETAERVERVLWVEKKMGNGSKTTWLTAEQREEWLVGENFGHLSIVF